MLKNIEYYELSLASDFDLENIFDYTEQEFGFNQAVKYLTDLETIFNSLIKNPEIGRKRNEIKKDLYNIPEQQHIVFYRILKNKIRIVRVLHASKDIPKNFKK